MINNKKSKLAFVQIFILIIGIVSFGYSFGVQIGNVSAIDCVDLTTGAIVTFSGTGCPSGFEPAKTAANVPTPVPYAQAALISTGTQQGPSKILSPIHGGKSYAQRMGTQASATFTGVPSPTNPNAYSPFLPKNFQLNPAATGSKQAIWETTKKATGEIFQAAFIASTISWGVRSALSWSGTEEETAASWGRGVGATYFTQKTLTTLFVKKGGFFAGSGVGNKLASTLGSSWGPLSSFTYLNVVALGAGILYGLATYKKEKVEVVSFECLPWQPESEGKNCEVCNEVGILGKCTEYQCKSLGLGCDLVNKGTTEQRCVWINERDKDFPTIEPWEETLSQGYQYNPDNTIGPLDRGVKIQNIQSDNNDGCIPSFTPIRFGVALNEPGRCKLDLVRKDTFAEMEMGWMGGSNLLVEEHSHFITMPGAEAFEEEGIELNNGGEFEIFVRCEDANENSNSGNFVFKFCIEEGPDATPPLIIGTNWLNNIPVPNGQEEVGVELYTNESADCKWSHTDKDYVDMENSMNCQQNLVNMNAQMVFTCDSTLSGLNDNQDNEFYFRCNDKPHLEGTANEGLRMENLESYVLNLIGTQPLVISSIEPENETLVKGSSSVVEVELDVVTSAGYDLGEAMCYASPTGNINDYIVFENTQSHSHSTSLWLESGSYNYHIRCNDLGGNFDTEIISFDVETDTQAPMIVRAYHKSSHLKLITNEEATCVYDEVSCDYSFDDGLSMNRIGDNEHYTSWNTNVNYYVKCKDEFGNLPAPDQCSMTVSPLEL